MKLIYVNAVNSAYTLTKLKLIFSSENSRL